MKLFEVVVTFILIAPLMITLVVLAISFFSAGVKDLINFLGERKKGPERPIPEVVPESKIDKYIEELKNQRKLQQRTA